ncbi:TPA: DNA-binding protein [Streptococcus agalactiae]|nr:DNA-binding protein [Streptococcus agalactiae]
MDEVFNQILNQFEAGLRERAIQVIRDIANDQTIYPAELTKKEVSRMFGIDTKTFDLRFNCHKDFPRISVKGGREKYPRDAALEWYNENWIKTGV